MYDKDTKNYEVLYSEILKELENSRFMVDVEREDINDYDELYYEIAEKIQNFYHDDYEDSGFAHYDNDSFYPDYAELYLAQVKNANLSIDLEISYDCYTGVIYDEFFYDEEDGDEFVC